MAKKKSNVSTPVSAYDEMAERWDLPDTLMGGTLTIRERRTDFLPQEPKESNTAYNNRLKKTFLYGAYSRTIRALAGLPFMAPVDIQKAPPSLDYLREDCDSMGTDITNLSHELLTDLLHKGVCHLLVDMPEVEGQITIEQQSLLKIRPYFTRINPTNLIGWKIGRIGGNNILTEIRIKEVVIEQGDDWEEVEVEQVRVITPSTFELWQKTKDDWVQVSEAENKLGYVPLVTAYGNKQGLLTGFPVLEDLAWLNLQHYIKLSDVANLEHLCNVPFILATGFVDGDLQGAEIGGNRLVTTDNSDADIKYVEPTGGSLADSRESIKEIETRMATMGSDVLTRRSVDRQTATARLMDRSESVSLLMVLINNLESEIQNAYKIAADWTSTTSEVVVNIGTQLRSSDEGPNYIDIILKYIQEQGGMSVDQAISELQRRNALSDTYKIEASTVVPNNEVVDTGEE